MKKLTDEEITKALECCGKEYSCERCILNTWLNKKRDCVGIILGDALDLINRQKEEIEILKKKANTPFAKVTFDENKLKKIVSDVAKNIEFNLNLIKSEVIKEFAERLKGKCYEDFQETYEMLSPYVTDDDIDDLVKEMTEVNEDE